MTKHQESVLQYRQALIDTAGNVAEAARRCGVSRYTVWRRLKLEDERILAEMQEVKT